MFEGRKMDLQFGIPKKETVKVVDVYEGRNLLIVHAAPAAKKQTFKFQLTESALKLLDLERENGEDVKTVSIAFVSPEEVYIVNSTNSDDIEAKSKYQISMNGIFSSKDAHKYLTKLLNLDSEVNHELAIHAVENNIPTGKLLVLTEKDSPIVEAIDTEEIKDDEFNRI